MENLKPFICGGVSSIVAEFGKIKSCYLQVILNNFLLIFKK